MPKRVPTWGKVRAAACVRNAGLIPAVIYGGDKAPASVTLELREVAKLLENEAAFSHVIALSVDGTKETVLIKALQRHPAKGYVMHADFLRVLADHKLTAHVPLHFLNEETAVGVKQGGGEVSHVISEVEVSCLPKDLPEFIEVDLAKVDVGQIVHLSDLKLPKGVELVQLLMAMTWPWPTSTLSRVVKKKAKAPPSNTREPLAYRKGPPS